MSEKLFFNAGIFGRSVNEDSVLINEGIIKAVGTKEHCMQRTSPAAEYIDCSDTLMLPGFIDSHTHLVETGEALIRPNIAEKSSADLMRFIRRISHNNHTGLPMIVMGLNDAQFTEIKTFRILPTEGGILIFHSSGHCAIADITAAGRLKRAVDNSGMLVIDEPYEDPDILMILQTYKKEPAHLASCVRAGIDRYHSYGVTSLQDNTWDKEVFDYYNNMVEDIDIDCWSKGVTELTAYSEAESFQKNIRLGPAKFFLDGAFFNKTAWLSEPWAGSDDWYGSGLPADEIINRITPAMAARRQCAFHAEGDRAISELCSALEMLVPHYPWIPELRIRIEHAQLINERDYDRIRNLGMVISAQPQACSDPARDIKLLGESRAQSAYPHKKILEEGIPLAFGSDFPYEEDFNPIKGIELVCNRSIGESLTIEAAISAYTSGSAYAGFSEKIKGRITEGYQADFSFMTKKNEVESVYFRGNCVFSQI